MSFPTDLIEAIIGWVALLEPGLKKSTRFLCALTSCAFVFPSQKHIFCTIDLGARPPTGVYYVRFHRLLLSNPYLGTHVRHLRLVDNTEDGFSNGISWLTVPDLRTLGFLPNLSSFGMINVKFSFKDNKSIKPSKRMRLAKAATLYFFARNTTITSLVSLTLSPLMVLFNLSKNSSMRLCSKLYSTNCPDQKRSSMQVQLKKTVSTACIAISTCGMEFVQEIDRYPTYPPTLVPPSQWYHHPGVNHQRRPRRCVLTNTIFISFP